MGADWKLFDCLLIEDWHELPWARPYMRKLHRGLKFFQKDVRQVMDHMGNMHGESVASEGRAFTIQEGREMFKWQNYYNIINRLLSTDGEDDADSTDDGTYE